MGSLPEGSAGLGNNLHWGIQEPVQPLWEGPKCHSAFLQVLPPCWQEFFSRRKGWDHFLSLLLTGSICERVTPRLSHANSAVVLSAVKVLMKFMEMLSKDLDYYGTLLKKLAPPLVTLLSAEPELQYVALRNINLIVQKRWVSWGPLSATGASIPLTAAVSQHIL